MIRGRMSAGSSARIKSSLRKKLLQVLPRQQNVACGRRFCRIFRGIRRRQRSSAGSRGRSCGTFFRRNPRKNLPHFFRMTPRKNTFFHYSTQKPLSHARKNLRLQPPPPQVTNVVYPKVPTAIYAIQTDTRRLED